MENVRIFFSDETFMTMKLEEKTTAKAICESVSKRKNLPLDEYLSLYVSDTNPFLQPRSWYQRKVQDEEIPYMIWIAVKKHNFMHQFRFMFMNDKHKAGPEEDLILDKPESSLNPEYKRFEKCVLFSYFERLVGQIGGSQDWREVFFTLQDGRLKYYKTHTSMRPQSIIDLGSCYVSEVTELASEGHVFEVTSPSEQVIMRASTREEMMKWLKFMGDFTSRISSENAQMEIVQMCVDQTEGFKNGLLEDNQRDVRNFASFMKHDIAVNRLLTFMVCGCFHVITVLILCPRNEHILQKFWSFGKRLRHTEQWMGHLNC
eukprot:TRINITY_DN8685_c0_g2_i1.p1 TRINITY_DN8685_c0_g2~~TRINITY_DN8685_c0_g2_i1.p1  ORF type:complete len:317 (-),score=70.11 TRINITY_DN8685_c0_g2_i1:446-1396(-)